MGKASYSAIFALQEKDGDMYVNTHVGATCGSSARDRHNIHTMCCIVTNSLATSDKLQGMKHI